MYNIYTTIIVLHRIFFLIYFTYFFKVSTMFVGFCHTATQISHNYTHILSLPSLPPLPLSDSSRSSLSTRLGSLFYTTISHKLSTLYLIVYICWCYYLHSFHSLPSTLGSQVHPLNLCLHSFSANRFTNISFS